MRAPGISPLPESPGGAARICVLGGGGFVGSHLVEALLAHPAARLTVIDTSLARLGHLDDGPRLQRIEGSVADEALLAAGVAPADLVLSLTALCVPSLYNTQPVRVIDANFTELLPLVELCARRRRWLVHFSTCEVYGRPPASAALMSEEETPLVLGPIRAERWTYSCAKQLLERLIWARGARGELPFTIIRPFNVIGPRMDFIPGVDGEGTPRVLACFIEALLRQRPLPLVDGGHQRRSFIYIDDFVEAVLGVLRHRAACEGEILNIGDPTNDITIAELARRMIEIYARRFGGDPALPCRSVPAQELYGEGYEDVERRIPDISKIQARTGWAPRTGLDRALARIFADYTARYGRLLDSEEGAGREKRFAGRGGAKEGAGREKRFAGRGGAKEGAGREKRFAGRRGAGDGRR